MKRNLRCFQTGMIALLILLTGTILNAQCPNGIVSYWDLNESTSTTYADVVNGHDAIVENAPSNTTGIIGNAKYFDGTKRVSVPAHADFNFSNATSFTIELWARFTDITFGSYNKIMIGRIGATTSTGVQWWVGSIQTSGTLTFFAMDESNTPYSVSTPKINDGAWHHVVAVRNADDNTLKIYVDGTLKNSAAATFTGGFASTSPIQMGYLNRNGVPEYWYKGDLDDIAIYNRALSTAEILDHRTKGLMGIGYCDGYTPKIKSTPVVTAAVGQLYTYDVHATGMAPITYALSKAPAGMTINASTGLISWTPASTTVDGTVTVVANNPSYPPADQQTFMINIAEAPVCPNGLLGLWKLNENSGPVYADQYGNHAIASVSPSSTTGIVNGAQTFDATSVVSIPDNGDFEWPATQNFSLEAWIKTSNAANSDNLVFIGRLRKDAYFTNWWIGLDASERPVFYLCDALGTDAQITGTTSLADGNWHHVVGVRDESVNKNFLYVDGAKVGEVSVNYPNSFTVDADDSVSVNIGWFNSGSMHHFTGEIDEVAIFNVALTPELITQYYNAKSPTGHCAAGNYAPNITSTPVTSATEDALYSYTFNTTDYDLTDLLTLSAQKKPVWLNFTWTTGQRTALLSGTPDNSNVGDTTVTLRVTDGTITKDQTFTLTVANTNDAPEITSTAVIEVDEGAAYSYTIIATDVDVNDVLTYAATVKPDWLSVNATTGVVSGTPAHEDVGDHEVTVTVSDGTDEDTQSFTITVNSINVAPTITGQATLSTNKNTALELTLANFTVTDPDNDYPADFTLSLIDGENYSVSGTTVTPDADYVGNINVGVQVSDGVAMSGIYYALVEVVTAQATDNRQVNPFSVYPVPARDHIYFAFEDRMESASIEIFSISGKLLKKIVVDEATEEVETNEFSSGIYLYRVMTGNKVYHGNFTVDKQ